jgi:hypothetical protein
MKRIAYVWLAGAILVGTLAALAGAQSESLGDYARAARKEKKPPVAKKFDNDNLPRTDKLSIVGNARPEPAAKTKDADAAEEEAAAEGDQSQAGAKSGESGKKSSDSADDRQKMYDEWKQKIAAQKEKVDLLARELDVMQREYRLRAAAFYADAGNRLRNQGDWDKEDAGYKQKIADKQKTVDAAKQQLDDLREQARKSGVPAGMRE